MAKTNSNDSITNLGHPARGNQPKLQSVVRVRVEGKMVPEPLTLEPVVQAEKDMDSGPSPTLEAGGPERPSAPVISRRVWHSEKPDHAVEPTSGDGDHWKKLYERADKFDKEFCDEWISEVDSIPTFAGLLAAVVTAFAVESYKLLQPDPQEITNHTLLNISAQLAGRNTTEPPSFTPSSSSLRINVFWFLSLTCTLMAGLVAILCKQWLRHYRRDISRPQKEALAMRQFRYDAFLRHRVVEILSAPPILLGIGLIFFFIGLVDFLQG
ncbi:hypothetical protein BD779DRAFT_1806134 [Infundibulicybe gibba]|nr:hypothetical protein BD779DRAFT_1806134 [Infundibulicybe gibba]